MVCSQYQQVFSINLASAKTPFSKQPAQEISPFVFQEYLMIFLLESIQSLDFCVGEIVRLLSSGARGPTAK